ncbi:hypothetical protein H7X87_03510 [Acetobacteraceae bacterium]|nr:hypothetical protein [Candidatus Parcubacteria bacterium]
MNNNLNNLKQEALHIRMSTAEKAAMQARIFSAPVSDAKKMQSPYIFFFSYQRAVAFALVLVVLVGSTTTYAAQGSVPGDVLYRVKVNVNEPVSGALAISNEAKISFHTSLAQERLKEAETLASEGKLDESATAQIEASFDTHVAKAQTLAADLEAQDPDAAAGVSITLDSSIAAHTNILERIGSESDDRATQENSRIIARAWTGRNNAGADASMALQAASGNVQSMSLSVANDAASSVNISAKIVTNASSSANATSSAQSQKKTAFQLQAKAKTALTDAKEEFDDAKSNLAATTSTQIKAQIVNLEERMEEGKKQYDNEQYDTARVTFTGVLQDSIELAASVEASKKFKQDFVRPVGERNINWWRSNNDDRGWNSNDDSVKNNSNDDATDHDMGDDNSSSNSNSDHSPNSGDVDLPDPLDLPVKLHL